MSKRCIICNKGTSTGKSVSKSKRATPKKFKANLQKIKIRKDGHKQRAYVCTRCIKAGKVQKAI